MQRGGSHYDNGGYSSRSENYDRSSNYGQRQHKQSVQSPWRPDANPSDSLNELNMQLEMVKKQRQMLQEQQQLLKAQQQLEQLQRQRNASPWQTQPNRQYSSQNQQNYNQYTNYANRYDRSADGEQRGYKRPAKPSPWQEQSQPKRFVPAPELKAFAPSPSQHGPSASWLNRQVDPAHPGTPMFFGEKTSSKSTKAKINTAVNFIMREMKQLYFCPPHNVKMENFQYYAMRARIIDRLHQLLMNKPVVSSLAIHQMYRKTHTAKGDLRLIQAMLALTEDDCELVTQKKTKTQSAKAAEPETVVKEIEVKETVAKETNEPEVADDIKENFQKTFDAKLTDIFKKISKIYAEEAVETAATDAEKVAADAEKVAADAERADQPEPKESVEPTTTVLAESSAESEEATKTAVSSTDGEKKELSERQVKALEFMVDTNLKRKLPQMLPLFKGFFLSIIAHDPEFAKFDFQSEAKPVQMDNLNYVKIFGRPMLPPRPLMQKFLSQFEPVSIKKHKTIYNLVVVGLTDDKFQLLLQHHGHTIGNKHLDIYAASQDKKERVMSNDNKEAINCETNTENSASKEVKIDDDTNAAVKAAEQQKEALMDAMNDLDNEIDELFTTIKESDEADKQENVDTVEDVEDTAESFNQSEGNVEETKDNTEKNGDNAVETGNNIEENVIKEDEAEDSTENSKENVAETGKAETNDSKTAGVVERTGDRVLEPENLGKEKNCNSEKIKAEEVKAPGTPASGICTRRSSRLPQNN